MLTVWSYIHLVYITMLKFHLRGVLRKIQDFLLYENNFEISVKGINDVLLRVGDACKSEYDLKIEKIRNAKWRYIDETGFKINGEKWWLWIFRTNDDETLVVIRKSRGRKVLDEILGKDHPGPHFSNDAGPTSSARSRPIKRHQNMENSYRKRYMLVSRN